jgi:hypothetical protein
MLLPLVAPIEIAAFAAVAPDNAAAVAKARTIFCISISKHQLDFEDAVNDFLPAARPKPKSYL